MGPLDDPQGTSSEDAVAAVAAALRSEAATDGYCWQVDHVLSGGSSAGGS